jgi:hypothetical protein
MVAVGAAVSVITLINTTVFPDHRTFMRNVSQGRTLINEIRDILCQFDPTQSFDNRDATLDEVREKLKRVTALKDSLLTPPSLLQWAGLASHAYAQAQMPSRVSKLLEDGASFFFLGVAENTSLTQAKEDSSRDTIEREIQTVLDTYKRAIEEKNITLFQSIFRRLAPTELRRLSESFAQANRQTVELKVEKIQVNGDEAEAKGRRKDVFVSTEGKTTRDESDFVFKLKHTPQGWVIMAAN